MTTIGSESLLRRTIPDERSFGAEARRGITLTLPLLAGVVPFGVAYGVLAREAGLSVRATIFMSSLMFAGSAQLMFVSLVAAGASGLVIVITVLVLNLRHLLYGVSLGPWFRHLTPIRWLVPAAVMTDESYGVTVSQLRARIGVARPEALLLGAGATLYVAYNLASAGGALLRDRIPDTTSLGLDLVFPLSFVALLVPLLRDRPAIQTAGVAAIVTLHLLPAGTGTAMIVGTLVGALVGAWRSPRQSEGDGA